jgi:2-dehydro-3-deoxygalactonokinase
MSISRSEPDAQDLGALDFVAVDWGTSRLRAWAMGENGSVLAHAASDEGMAVLERDSYEPVLLRLIGSWLPLGPVTPVIACGMVGARQGWIEAPYIEIPSAAIVSRRMAVAPTRDPRIAVHVIPGLCQRSPADVMRGEETQIAGFLEGHPDFAGVICMPGTHSKWVRIRDGVVTGFRTLMTGELFGLLAEHSILRHGIGPGWNSDEFTAALTSACAEPANLVGQLFSIRAEGLLADLDPGAARARLSGLLIGSELAAARAFLEVGDVAVIGASELADLYVSALAAGGHAARAVDVGASTRAGLAAARLNIRGSSR